MPAWLLATAALGAAAAGLHASPRRAFLLLACTVLLVPATLVVPNGVTPIPTVVRLVTVAVGLGLLVRAGSAEERRELFRPTPVHLAAGLYLLGILATGVVLAVPAVRPADALQSWLGQVEPFVVFVVALAAARAVRGPRALVQALALVAGATVLVGLLEHLSGGSWGHLLFGGKGSRGSGPAGLPLETRDGSTRIRGGEEFALAYGWVLAALVPAVLAVRARRLTPVLAVVGLAGCLLGAYWSFSRSAPLGFAVAFLVVAVGLRSWRVTAGLVVASVALLSVGMALPSVSHRFSSAADEGALLVRSARRPVVLSAVADRPVRGLGLTGVADLGIGETDQSFLLSYGETGVVGVVLLVGVVAAGLVATGRGLRGPATEARTAATVALGGAAVLTVSGAAFDAFAVRGTADLLWLLVGVGVAAAETARGPWTLPRVTRHGVAVRVAGVAAAVAAGGAVAVLWPSTTAVTVGFSTLTTARESGDYDPVDTGRTLVATTCSVAAEVQRRTPDTTVDCRGVEPGAGVGELRVAAATTDLVGRTVDAIATTVRERTRVPALRLSQAGPVVRSRPAAARTAPVSAGLAALLLALLVPGQRGEPRPRRRSWRMGRGDVRARLPRENGAPVGVQEQADQRVRELRGRRGRHALRA